MKKIAMSAKTWCKLACKESELQLLGTLNGGQSFRWETKPNNEWIGVFADKVWCLKQEKDHILYQVYECEDDNCEVPKKKQKIDCNETHYKTLLENYFHLSVPLKHHYQQWSESDPFFKSAAQQFYGIRILNQDLVENIFSFICSSNNNIKRISAMVNKLAKFYGKRICEIDGETYYAFPTVEQLTGPKVEEMLKANSFGYRAKYIANSAKKIVDNGGTKWLEKLKEMEYVEAKNMLMTLPGIGAKVADCICLMSLGHLQAIPVDTHIYQIAKRLYLPQLAKQKTVTEKIYAQIGDHFRNLYGPLAGWAHTVLFCADLKKFNSSDETGSEINGTTKKNTSKSKRKNSL